MTTVDQIMTTGNEMLNKRLNWTLEDNVKKAIQIADLEAKLECVKDWFHRYGDQIETTDAFVKLVDIIRDE